MLVRPFPHQEEAITAGIAYLNEKEEDGLIAAPTGTGKSVMIGGLIERARKFYGEVRFEVLTHVEELVEQNHKKMTEISPLTPAGIYCAGLNRRDTNAPVTFASIGSVHRRPGVLGASNVILVDEVQMVNPKQSGMYRSYIEAKRSMNPNLRVLGYSATIFRMGLGLLTEGDLFSDVVYDITGYQAFNQLIADGFLMPLVTFPTDTQFDLSGVGIQNTGEYKQGELEHAMMDDEHQTFLALEELVAIGRTQGRKSWLIFASGVDHAHQVSNLLSDFGIEAPVITSDTPKEERRAVLRDFRAGKIPCIVNNNVLTTGFDAPGVDLIGVLRATKSSGLWVQMLGRGTRPVWAPGFDIHVLAQRLEAIKQGGKENCLVLDYTRNTETLGPVNDPVIPRPKGKRIGPPPPAPVRPCPACNAYNHVLAKFCISCKAPLPVYDRPIEILNRSKHEVMRRDEEPQVELFDVTRITYSKHTKEGRPPSLLVEYYCGWRSFREWVCFEHEGSAKNLARKWWHRRMRAMHGEDVPPPPPPETIDELLPFAHMLPVPKRIRVWYNRKPYPEVLSHEFGSDADVGHDMGAAAPESQLPGMYELRAGKLQAR
jgi:DNA repair protein RadD